MTRVLYLGLDPRSVDFSDPSLPPGLDAAKIQAGIDAAVTSLTQRGWEAVSCMFTPDEDGFARLDRTLADGAYDVVVIGAGIRLPPKNLALLERVVNAARQVAPIAFNTTPQDTADAAARGMGA